jgi:hypothetical protein
MGLTSSEQPRAAPRRRNLFRRIAPRVWRNRGYLYFLVPILVIGLMTRWFDLQLGNLTVDYF